MQRFGAASLRIAWRLVAVLSAFQVASPRAAQALDETTAPDVAFRWSLPGHVPARIATADGRVFVLMRPQARTKVYVVDGLQTSDADGAPHGDLALTVPRRAKDLALVRTRTFDPATQLHVNHERLYFATAKNDAELVVVDVPPGAAVVERTIDLPGNADALAIALDGDLIYVGRAHSAHDAELLVLDTAGSVVGSLDLPQSIEDIAVTPLGLRASSRTLSFDVDVSVPAHPALLATSPREPRPAPPLPVAKVVDDLVDGPLAYLAVKKNGEEVQRINLHRAFDFPDRDGDGRWTLGCLGDSNTAPQAGITRWCEKLASLVDDPRFSVVNLAVAGATAIPSGNSAYDQVALAVDPDLALDAVVLSFGTNDTNLVNFSTNPALFATQIASIADHLEHHFATLESQGIKAYVATVPPRFKALFGPDGFNERIVALNEQIRARFPADAIIEHYDYFYADTSEIIDGVHLNQRGQDKRAWRALQVIER